MTASCDFVYAEWSLKLHGHARMPLQLLSLAVTTAVSSVIESLQQHESCGTDLLASFTKTNDVSRIEQCRSTIRGILKVYASELSRAVVCAGRVRA